MKRLSINLAVVLCLLLLVLPACPAAAKENWTSVRSQNFFLVGNASEKDIKQVATRLEQFRFVFSKLLTKVNFTSPVPTTVIVFKSDSAYKPYKTNPNIAGYFQPGEDVNYITLTSELRSTESPYRTIYHEYVHLLVDNTLGHTIPVWFNEGLAEYYSTFTVENEQKAILGELISNHVYFLREQKLIPLRTLFAVDHNSPYYNEGNKMNAFYAESWMLVHYLIQGNKGARRQQLGRYLDLVRTNLPVEEAFKQAFQTTFEGMEKELKDYIRGNSYMATSASFPQKLTFDSEMQSAPISEAEARAYLGDLLLHTRRLKEAEDHLQQALTLDPNLAMAHAALGMVRVRQNRFDEARQSLERAVAANSQNYLAHYYYAYALSRQGMNDMGLVTGYPAENVKLMRDELKKAIALKPDFPESYDLLAFVNLVTGEQLDESVDLLKKALALSPGRQQFSIMLAQLYLRKQDYKSARQLLEPIASNSTDRQAKQQATMLLSQLTNMEEQLARFKAMSESAGSENTGPPPPRLNRSGGSNNNTSVKSEDSQEANTDPYKYLEEVLRKPVEGEVRVQGMLQRIDCDAKGITFIIKAGDRLLKLHTDSFEHMDITTYTTDVGGNISCGPRKPENPVVVTYLPSKDAKSRVDGNATGLEFVPKEFKLKS